MRVLITGANGLLGHNVIQKLLQADYEVRALVRNKKSLYISSDKLEVLEGNFLDYNDLNKASETCGAFIHIAATTDMAPLKYSHYERIIVEGSQNVVRVCKEQKIRRVVYISTANTIGYGNFGELATEGAPIKYPFSKSFYAIAKTEAEKLFVAYAKDTDNHVVILNPTFMLGAYDTKPSSGAMVLTGHKKYILTIPKGGKNFVHVQDVATAAVNALTKGKSGERYIAGNQNLSLKEFYAIQKEISGYPRYIILLPNTLLIVVGALGDLLRKMQIPAIFSSINLKQLSVQEYYSCRKIIEDLEMPQTSIKKAISDSLNWFVKIKKIKPTKKMEADE